jgi:hypothetical protein
MNTLLNPDDLLKLVADSELDKFTELVGISGTTILTRAEIVAALATYSRTRVLNAILEINGIWIAMMSDIVKFLETHGVSFRTTGCVLSFGFDDTNSRSHLSTQVADVLATFDLRSIRNLSDWESAELKWTKTFRPWVQQIFRNGHRQSAKTICLGQQYAPAINDGMNGFGLSRTFCYLQISNVRQRLLICSN